MDKEVCNFFDPCCRSENNEKAERPIQIEFTVKCKLLT
jgi:hypothetical protein